MKKSKGLINSLLVLSVTSAMFFSFGGSSSAVEAPDVAAKGVVQNYLTAMEIKNFSKATSYVRDFRYQDTQKQIAKYETYSNSTNFNNVKILSATTETESKVSVKILNNQSNTTFEDTLKVIKEGEQWKVALGDGDEATIKALNAPEFSTRADVDYYSFNNIKSGVTLYTDDAYSVTNPNNIVTIQGWQHDGGIQNHVAGMTYRVVQDVWSGWQNWGVEQPVNADSDPNNSSTWYSIIFQGIPTGSNYHIKITGTSTQGYGAYGAGNVYQ